MMAGEFVNTNCKHADFQLNGAALAVSCVSIRQIAASLLLAAWCVALL
jgi:hypothetical protein